MKYILGESYFYYLDKIRCLLFVQTTEEIAVLLFVVLLLCLKKSTVSLNGSWITSTDQPSSLLHLVRHPLHAQSVLFRRRCASLTDIPLTLLVAFTLKY